MLKSLLYLLIKWALYKLIFLLMIPHLHYSIHYDDTSTLTNASHNPPFYVPCLLGCNQGFERGNKYGKMKITLESGCVVLSTSLLIKVAFLLLFSSLSSFSSPCAYSIDVFRKKYSRLNKFSPSKDESS